MMAERKPGSFAGHAALYAIGNIVGRLVGFIMLPVYTRYLTTADYGAVGLLAFALSLMEPLLGARMARAIPKFYFDAQGGKERRSVIWNALVLTGAVSTITTAAIILLRRPAAELLFGTPRYALATALFAVNMLSQPVEYTGMMYLRLRERSRLFLVISMAKLAVQVSLNLLLIVAWRLGVVGVILSGVISSVALGVALTIYIAIHEPPAIDRGLARRMLQFCWPLWFSGLAGLYIGSSGALYLRVFDSLSDVGLLELGLRFAAAVGLLVWVPFFQHWEPLSYRYYREPGGREKFQVAFVTIALFMFAAGLGISLFSGPAIRMMAAPPFHAAARTVPLLTLGVILSSLMAFFNFGFLVAERTKLHSVCQYITAVVITIAYVVLIPRFGLEGAIIGQCVALAFHFLLTHFWSRKYYDPGLDLAPVGLFLAIAALTYVVSTFTDQGTLVFSLIAKVMMLLLAIGIMSVVALRYIRASSATVYGSIWIALGKLSRRNANGSSRG